MMEKKLIHIGNILEGSLKDLRPCSDLGMTRIWEMWDDTVGELTGREAKPGAFRDGTLIVHVSNSVWLHHLRFLQEKMKEDLNNALGETIIKELRFKIAALHN